jgi:hypothetical protein
MFAVDKDKIPKVVIGARIGYRQADADKYVGETEYRNHVKPIKTIGHFYYLRDDLDRYLKKAPVL